jgi:hypothetical protein
VTLPDLGWRVALRQFATATVTQSQDHIRPIHRHLAFRLVCEGGFLPDELTPHPPLRASRQGQRWLLEFAPEAETSEELTVFGGMKTKQIDVVVTKPTVGPVVAVSVKGTLGAYRNLTNRMEEAIGDSTNLHVMYPGLVYGFLHLLRANREAAGHDRKDAAILTGGSVSPMVERYHAALCEMAGRRFVRNDLTRYEAVALAVVENNCRTSADISPDFPVASSPLRWESFFATLYRIYDSRFALRGSEVRGIRRLEWDADSPLFRSADWAAVTADPLALGFVPRVG